MTRTQTSILIGSVALIAVVATAVGASYFTRESLTAPAPVAQQAQTHTVHHSYQQASQQGTVTQQALPPCNDHNIVGTLGGAVAGGLVGNQFGKGTGRTVATVGGAAGGAYLGNEYIPTRGATCR